MRGTRHGTSAASKSSCIDIIGKTTVIEFCVVQNVWRMSFDLLPVGIEIEVGDCLRLAELFGVVLAALFGVVLVQTPPG